MQSTADRFAEIERAIGRWAGSDARVHGAMVLGSRARTTSPADDYSDLDIVIFSDDPDGMLDRPDWLDQIGNVTLTFVEGTAVGGWRERRVIFAPLLDVDFSIVPAELLQIEFSQAGPAQALVLPIVARGARVLFDPTGKLTALAGLTLPPPPTWTPPTAAEFDNLVADFWYHALWTARKARRGELMVARECLDSSMKDKLRTMARWQANLEHPGVDTWHGYRFFERWADPSVVRGLAQTCTGGSAKAIIADLEATMDMFVSISTATATSLKYKTPDAAMAAIRTWIGDH